MTYLFFVNGVYWDSTRNVQQAFQWFDEWDKAGHSPGLKFVSDRDEEALNWLVPQEVSTAIQPAA